MSTKDSSPRKGPASSSGKAPAREIAEKRSMRDAPRRPTHQQIERSIQKGTVRSAEDFRALVGW